MIDYSQLIDITRSSQYHRHAVSRGVLLTSKPDLVLCCHKGLFYTWRYDTIVKYNLVLILGFITTGTTNTEN